MAKLIFSFFFMPILQFPEAAHPASFKGEIIKVEIMLTKDEINEIKKSCILIVQNNNESTARKTKTLKIIKFRKNFIEKIYIYCKISKLNKYILYYDKYLNKLESSIKLEKELNNIIFDFYCKISELY